MNIPVPQIQSHCLQAIQAITDTITHVQTLLQGLRPFCADAQSASQLDEAVNSLNAQQSWIPELREHITSIRIKDTPGIPDNGQVEDHDNGQEQEGEE